ncbi:DUF3299 domain-containing protein [Rhodoferax sp. U11-2br]|uniref:DUF3299 domain-containing protein n=1 Tax=Rhodoferax sp. U11-2br TaxID=2838878 RepID=UPI001BEB661C|nr:DUF3299 domain-containing protein [Rhodoferax sp. U11-2br]MBT3065726.1 DUF3299 domain-containing protein [Rhodoferax sp. U11-2br]
MSFTKGLSMTDGLRATGRLGWRGVALTVLLLATAAPTLAQLSSPMAGVPAGTGPGVHSPNSPFAPLVERADVLPWSLLSDVKVNVVKKRVLPTFPAAVLALDGKTQRVQGFMMPLSPGQKQTHFLLTSVPLTCAFCTPGGPESMIEVKTRTPVKYSLEPVLVEGTLAVLSDDPTGLYYRMQDGQQTR